MVKQKSSSEKSKKDDERELVKLTDRAEFKKQKIYVSIENADKE